MNPFERIVNRYRTLPKVDLAQGHSIAYSRSTTRRLMELIDANAHGNVHGGVIMRMVDEAAAIVAIKHSQNPTVVTARVERFDFLAPAFIRSEEHTSELQSQSNLVCRLLLEKKNEQDCQSKNGAHTKAEPPTNVHGEEMWVEQHHRHGSADLRPDPPAAIDRDIHVATNSRCDELINSGVNCRILPTDSRARQEAADGDPDEVG